MGDQPKPEDKNLDLSDKTVKEGNAEVFLPTSVFYNPVQEFNRDLTIAVISQHAREYFKTLDAKTNIKRTSTFPETSEGIAVSNEIKEEEPSDIPESEGRTNSDGSDVLEKGRKYDNGLKILEGLAASGLRSVRFALEIPGLKEVVANDFDKNAVDFITKNVAHNNIGNLVTPSCADAAMLMYQSRHFRDRFDVIDLDPYGSPSIFLDSAVQAVKDGGLLCVTCTDMAILCGNAAETCYSKYGAMSYRSRYCHEMALRIVLQSIESHANRYSRYIQPLLSLSVDFYLRVFVRVFTGQNKVKQSVSKMAMVYHCVGCGSFNLQPLGLAIPTKGDSFKYTPASGPPVMPHCSHCGNRHIIGGPIWADNIHDVDFVQSVIDSVIQEKCQFNTMDRMIGMLNVVTEEIPDQPLYYVTDELCKVLHCTAPSMLQIRSAILTACYKVSLSHAEKNSIKTNAPAEVIWDILRCWVKENPVKERRLKEGSVASSILSKSPTIQVSFKIREDANPKSRKKGLVRWQANPEPDWGPKARARRGHVETLEERRVKGMTKAMDRKMKRKAEERSSEEEDAPNKKLSAPEKEKEPVKEVPMEQSS